MCIFSPDFSVVQASIFKFLHEPLFPYFKFNFSEIKFFFLPLHPNLLLLLPQPPTPNLFLPQTPLSKSVASLAILLKPEAIWPSLTQSFPSFATCNPSASLLLYLNIPSIITSVYCDHYLSNPSP